jgi:hypothetical protein
MTTHYFHRLSGLNAPSGPALRTTILPSRLRGRVDPTFRAEAGSIRDRDCDYSKFDDGIKRLRGAITASSAEHQLSCGVGAGKVRDRRRARGVPTRAPDSATRRPGGLERQAERTGRCGHGWTLEDGQLKPLARPRGGVALGCGRCSGCRGREHHRPEQMLRRIAPTTRWTSLSRHADDGLVERSGPLGTEEGGIAKGEDPSIGGD